MHREAIDSNAVVSAHSRENAIYKLLKNAIQSETSSRRGIYYWNKKRAIQMARIHGVQFPGISTITDGYVHSITDFSENVNRFSKNIFKTKQFKRWFGNSIALVKNSDGTPRAFYHGSVEDFDTFDKSRIRADDYDAPFNPRRIANGNSSRS